MGTPESAHSKKRSGMGRFRSAGSNLCRLIIVIFISTYLGFIFGSRRKDITPHRKIRAMETHIVVLSKSSPFQLALPPILESQRNSSKGIMSHDGSGVPIHHSLASWVKLKLILGRMVVGRPVVGTIANFAFKDMLLNWYAHTQKSGMTNIIVVTLDNELYTDCGKLGMECLLLSGLPSKSDFRKDAEAFKDMGSLKTAFILTVLELGWDILMSDTDVAWTANPEELLRVDGPMGFADAMLSSDSVSISNDAASMAANPVVDSGDPQTWFRFASPRALEVFGNVYEHAMNTGVLFIRSNSVSIKFCQEWHQVMRTKGKSRGWVRVWGDQHALNELMRMEMFPIKVVEPPPGRERHNRIFWTFNNTMRVGIFSPAEFCNGHVFFVQRTPQKQKTKVYSVHNTFQYYYGPGKIARFREEGLWLLDPKKYYSEGKFLSFDVTTPAWIDELPEGIARHQAAIAYYYRATRNALALATISNRILILPKVKCFCDRWWDSLTAPCRAPGTDVDPPFTCPVDHFLNLQAWRTEHEYIRYRESSFLDNPSVDPAIKQSRAVLLLEGRDGGPEQYNVVPVRMRVNSSDFEAAAALQFVSQFRVVHLPDAVNAFCRFVKREDNTFFDTSTKDKFCLEWCCTPERRHVNVTLSPLAETTFASCNHESPG